MPQMYEKGQVVIPEYIRRLFKLVPGIEVSFQVEGNRIILEPENEVLREMRALRAELATHTSEETDAMIARAEAKRRAELVKHVH